MEKFTFNGDEELTYIDIQVDGHTLVASPGESYDLDEAPDERWSTVKQAKADTTVVTADLTKNDAPEGEGA